MVNKRLSVIYGIYTLFLLLCVVLVGCDRGDKGRSMAKPFSLNTVACHGDVCQIQNQEVSQ